MEVGLPRTFQVLAMTKSEVPDESDNYEKGWAGTSPAHFKLNAFSSSRFSLSV
jgi:hypothetical protein